MNDPEILTKAARIVRVNGWIQGGFTSRAGGAAAKGPCDVLGAIGIAAHGKPWHLAGLDGPIRALAAHLGLPADVVALAAWNDTRGRTAREVATALRGAARRAERSKKLKGARS